MHPIESTAQITEQRIQLDKEISIIAPPKGHSRLKKVALSQKEWPPLEPSRTEQVTATPPANSWTRKKSRKEAREKEK